MNDTLFIFPLRFCEDGIIESVSTLIWVAPRLSAELQELSVVNIYVMYTCDHLIHPREKNSSNIKKPM